MSEERNLNKLSIQDLEKEKIQAEIDILKARLDKEYPDEKPPGRFARLAEFGRKSSAFLLGALTLFSAIWGVFIPLSEYLEEQRKALEYDLNENMIGLVDSLNSPNPIVANRSIMMLSYYEVNSIPILLFFLESSRDPEFIDKINETIGLIYSDNRGTEIVEVVLTRIQNNFDEIKDEFSQTGSVNDKRRLALLNYLELMDALKLRKTDQKEANKVCTEIRAQICQDKALEETIITVFWTICDFLDADYNCETVQQ